MNSCHWPVLDRILTLETQWLTLIGEHLQDDRGTVLEYWRVEKADSVVILPIQRGHLVLPVPTYRPGVGKPTLDFPGGRCPANQLPKQAVAGILKRELALPETAASVAPLNQEGWAINSAFSNQRLYGFVAEIQPNVEIPAARVAGTYRADLEGLHALLKVLHCLQCRLVLREWQVQQKGE
ncbi:NUDIX hydrolase [filamentous cyanobacterium CCP5]|nr:NUDIX hydrolase [filamentous cyanobacterium CCP5]